MMSNPLIDFASKGFGYKRTRLTPSVLDFLRREMADMLERTFDMPDHEFELVMEGTAYIKQRLSKRSVGKPSKKVAYWLAGWSDEWSKHLDEHALEKRAAQWIHNLWCRHYSALEIVRHADGV